MGEYFDAGDTRELSDFKAKYIILNDGFPEIWNKFILDNRDIAIGKIIIKSYFFISC